VYIRKTNNNENNENTQKSKSCSRLSKIPKYIGNSNSSIAKKSLNTKHININSKYM